MKEKNGSNPSKRAIALGYDLHKNEAPIVKAKGDGFVAQEMIEKAKEYHIPIEEDPSLVEILGQLNVNESIPLELYEVVAEIFAFIYRMDQTIK